jgi:hypothetical protein
MPRRLPQLNALKAFEAAARHVSFTRAAEELCVTQGAVKRGATRLGPNTGKKLRNVSSIGSRRAADHIQAGSKSQDSKSTRHYFSAVAYPQR